MPGRKGVDWGVCTTFARADAAISQVAARQRALITRAQLIDLEIGRRAIDYAIARGRLHVMHRGVFALVQPAALPPFAREHAAVLACGERALLSHHSAAAIWGIRPLLNGDVDITIVGSDCGRTRTGIHIHRTNVLHLRDTVRYSGLPITSPARTLLDIAPHTSGRSLEWAIDQALTKRLTSTTAIQAVLKTYPHRPGTARLTALTDPDRPTTLTSSPPEERLFAHLRKAGLPIPEVNAKVGRYTADFLWRAEKVILEIDGYQYHHTRATFERDHRRDTEHQRDDFLVIRVTPRQLEHNLPALLVQIAITLDRRRPVP